MIPFATKNQLNQVEKHLEEKTQTPPNVEVNEGFGYIHELAITDEENPRINIARLVVRLDTEEAVPAFQQNNGSAEDTLAFLVEHLINVLYFKYTDTNDKTTYDTITLYRESTLGDIVMFSVSPIVSYGELYIVRGLEDITE